jgi:hypothetical protein
MTGLVGAPDNNESVDELHNWFAIERKTNDSANFKPNKNNFEKKPEGFESKNPNNFTFFNERQSFETLTKKMETFQSVGYSSHHETIGKHLRLEDTRATYDNIPIKTLAYASFGADTDDKADKKVYYADLMASNVPHYSKHPSFKK